MVLAVVGVPPGVGVSGSVLLVSLVPDIRSRGKDVARFPWTGHQHVVHFRGMTELTDGKLTLGISPKSLGFPSILTTL